MRYFFWALIIFALLLVQNAILQPLRLPASLLLVLVIVSLLFAEFNFGLGLALACGIVLDFLSGSPDGIMSVVFVSVFLLMYFAVNFILSREPNLPILFSSVAVGTTVYFLLLLLAGRLLGRSWLFAKDFPLTLFINLLATYPILWIHSRLTPQRAVN